MPTEQPPTAPIHPFPFFSARTRRTLGYVLVVVAGVVGFWKLNSFQNSLSSSSRHRADDLCAIATSDRQVVRVLVDAATAPVSPPPNSSQEVKDSYAASNQRASSLRDFGDKLLAPINCASVVSGKPIPAPSSPTVLPTLAP